MSEPRSRAFLDEAVRWSVLGTLIAMQVVVSVLPALVGWLLGLDLGPTWGVAVLLAAQMPILVALRYAVTRRRGLLFTVSLHVLTIAQGLWIHAIFLDTLSGLPVLGAVLVVGLSAAWAFNDAQCVYDDLGVRLAHATPILFIDLGLLLLDLMGGRGLVALGREDLPSLATLVLVQALALGLSQMILASAGALNRGHHAAIEQLVVERRKVEEERSERAFVRRVGDLLTGSLTVGRFSHDVAGPLMVIQHTSEELELRLGGHQDPEVGVLLEDLSHARANLTEMVGFMNRCLRGEQRQDPVAVDDLIAQARGHLRDLLRGHGILGKPAELVVDVDEAVVCVDPLQSTALANVAANGVLASGQAVHIVGRARDAKTYRLTVRDHGVDGPERLKALVRIRETMQLRGDAPARIGAYQGHGLGLVLARMISLRNGGELSVEVPEDGPGLVVHVDLRLESDDLGPSGTAGAADAHAAAG